MLRRFTKKRAIVALSVVAVLAMASAAIAYFTSTGDGSGNAVVGMSSNYTVTADAATGGALLPGFGTDTIAYHVKNVSSGKQAVQNISATLNTNTSGDVYDTTKGQYATGCLATWFTVTNSPGTLPDDLAGGATHNGSVSISLNDSGSPQDACQNVTPQILVHAS
jgi:hypothetical protein